MQAYVYKHTYRRESESASGSVDCQQAVSYRRERERERESESASESVDCEQAVSYRRERERARESERARERVSRLRASRIVIDCMLVYARVCAFERSAFSSIRILAHTREYTYSIRTSRRIEENARSFERSVFTAT
jgi:hypothetical protein